MGWTGPVTDINEGQTNMAKSFTGPEFVKALSEGGLREPIVREGMVKPSENDTTSIEFSEGNMCELWTKIPVDMIERVEYVSNIRCQDHQHPLVRLFLKEPPAENKLAGVLSELLRANPRVRGQKTVARAASGWACGCSGTCYDGTGTGATGYGSTIAEAISDCESRLKSTCLDNGGLKTYVGGGCSEA
jgi:hypothetical protein